MRVALLGGTGDIGEGLALRWARETDHEIVVGSRKAEKAADKAAEYEAELADRGLDREVAGLPNEAAAEGADLVVLSVPPQYAADTVEGIAEALAEDAILVSPAVGMTRDEDGFHYNPPPNADSVTEYVAEAAPDRVSVVGAFHNISANRLADLDEDLDADILVLGGEKDEDAKETVRDLTRAIPGLRPVDAGPLSNAHEVEGITPLLINIAMHNDDMSHVGVTFH